MEARTKKSNTMEIWNRAADTVCFLMLTGGVDWQMRLIDDFVAKFLNHRVCQDFLGHALDLLFGGFARDALQV